MAILAEVILNGVSVSGLGRHTGPLGGGNQHAEAEFRALFAASEANGSFDNAVFLVAHYAALNPVIGVHADAGVNRSLTVAFAD
ncbi:MAG: hypothetical protein ABEI52_02420, partial [Halobacteriaceae archaeon]